MNEPSGCGSGRQWRGGGRVVLGVGLGVPAEIEYGAFGEPTDSRIHAAMLDEALPILDAFLRGDPVDHAGDPCPPLGRHLSAHLGHRAVSGWDVVTALGPGMIVKELGEAGATWVIDGPGPDEPFDERLRRIALGPPR